MIRTTNHPSNLKRTALALSISAAISLTSTTAFAEEDSIALPVIEVADTNLEYEDSYAAGQVNTKTNVGLLGSQSIFNTPYSVVSFTSDLIEDQQADTVAEVIANDPSTRLHSAVGSTSQTISVRGFNTGSSGTELYDGLPGLAHRLGSSVKVLERVEIFKGANALLTGATGAPGGIINLVPKTPNDRPLTRLTTSYASDEELSTHLDLSRRFGNNDAFGVRFNGILQDGEGSTDNAVNKLKEATLALQYKKDKLQLDAIFDRSEQDSSASPQQFSARNLSATTPTPDAPKGDNSIQQDWENTDNEFSRFYIKSQYQLSDTWSMHGAYGESEFNDYFLRTIGTFNNTGNDGDFTQKASQYYREVDRSSARAGIEGLFNTDTVSHQVSFDALTYTDETGDNYQNGPENVSNIYNPTAYSINDFTFTNNVDRDVNVENKNTSTSFALSDVIGFYDDQFLLTLGARHQEVEQIKYTATGAVDSEYKESAITPSIGFVVKSSDALSLYGNYIESLEAGVEVPTGYSLANEGEILDPYVTKQLEFGAKWNLGTIGLTAAVFQIEKPSVFADDNNNYDLNGEQRNRGIELSAFGNLTQNLRLLGGMTYLDAKLTKTKNGTQDGNTVIAVPELSVVMGFELDIPSLQELTLTGRVNHVGKQYINKDNTRDIPSYEIYSVGARYVATIADKEVTFRANVDNLFDEAYWSAFTGADNLLYAGSSRQVNLSAAIDF